MKGYKAETFMSTTICAVKKPIIKKLGKDLIRSETKRERKKHQRITHAEVDAKQMKTDNKSHLVSNKTFRLKN
jgi:cysteine synthase